MQATRYQAEAQVTLSHSFFGEFVSFKELIDALNEAIIACAKVDKLKKVLFYGRGIQERAEVRRKAGETLGSVPMTGKQEELLHALIGVGTEGAECFEILRDWLHGMWTGTYSDDFEFKSLGFNAPDPKLAKVLEEVGGTLWYIAIAAQATGVSIEDIMQFNIGQLRARYKDKFDAYEANHRNLAFEKSVMANLASDGKQAAAVTLVDAMTPETHRATADEEAARYTAQVRAGMQSNVLTPGVTRSVPLRGNND